MFYLYDTAVKKTARISDGTPYIYDSYHEPWHNYNHNHRPRYEVRPLFDGAISYGEASYNRDGGIHWATKLF